MKKLVLIGYMGSGKSTIGKLLADTLSFPFYDLDDIIVEREKRSIQEIFDAKGEIYFRKIEQQIFFEYLNNNDSFVLATGGGTPCYGAIMAETLKYQHIETIYLKTPLNILTDRLWLQKNTRPLISHLNKKELLNDFIRKHLFERSYYYAQSKNVIDINQQEPQEIVEEIVSTLF